MDYQALGFKCGVEVHNRLATKHKLFCNCPARFSNFPSSRSVKRKLRPVAGELGAIDVAAIYEYLRDRTFHYQIFSDAVCLVELDEEPPHDLNKEALEVALQVAMLLKCEIPEEIHVMRKTVIDGSNTAGFQRTAIVGLNGVLQTSLGPIKITTVAVEEESAGIVEQKENDVVYRLDRLGIPLIEIGTAPDIKNPEHAKEIAGKLGMIIRSTGKSQRGIGVTRQDVNVSIKGGARVEVKGVQELDLIPRIIESEVLRQKSLIEKGQKPREETRVAKADGSTDFTRPLPGGERMYPETDIPPIAVTKETLSEIELPETWDSKRKRFLKILPKDLAEQVLWSEYLNVFEEFYKKHDPVLVASTLTSTVKDLRRRGFEIDGLVEKEFDNIFSAVKNKKISKEAISQILELIAGEKLSFNEAVKKAGIEALSENELRKTIKKIFEKYPHLVKEKKVSALMGEVMKDVRGRIDGKTVAKILNEELR